MAHFSGNNAQTISLGVRLAEMYDAAVTAYGNWRIYRRTLVELQSLSGREMADLGIDPSMIRRIALEAAYGKSA